MGDFNNFVNQRAELGVPSGGDRNDPPLAGANFLHVRQNLFVRPVFGNQSHGRKRGINQRDGTVLHFARGVAFRVDVGNLLELQRPFERNRVLVFAPNV